MKAVILVGLRNDGGERDEIWRENKQRWAELLGWPTFEGYHDDGPFNLAAASNRAAAAAGDWDLALLVGGDTWSPGMARLAPTARLLNDAEAATFGPYYELDPDGNPLQPPVSPHAGTAAMLVTRELWDEVGGFDERFRGWGWEDVAFLAACSTLGRVRHVSGAVYHVHHARDPGRGEHPHVDANLRLGQRYLDAQGDEAAMRALIAERTAPPTGGFVAVAADEAGRFTRFAVSMQGLRLPASARTIWQLGNDISGNRNGAAQQLLDGGGEWLWFIDDDHTFRPDTLLRLLGHGLDIVAPLVLRRQQPFLPVAATDGDFLDLGRYGADDLVEVEHTGSAGMLIRRRVFEALEPPWFELGHDDDGRRISEDVVFCRKAAAAGFEIHVDLGVRLGHITTAVVVPAWNEAEGRWLTGFDIADGAQLTIELGTFVAAPAGRE